ncbi:MAG: lipopolysaccharide kinase InaA family protein [Longimicrobiales bacterium]|nr:lipopolysaccharide kinase InaA family protein [Longimicrobiales bacterium]
MRAGDADPRHRSLPDGYRRRRLADARAVVHRSADAWLEDVLSGGKTLHEWAGEQPDHGTFAGRGTVFSIPAPDVGPEGRRRWAVRHYRRGGAMASCLEDRYLRLGRPRPFRELDAATTARSRGIRTPAILAGVVYPAGLYYRADLVTEVVPEARTLATLLHEHDGSRAWTDAMAAAGALVNEMGDAGVFHVDLNAMNVIFESGRISQPWVLDLDRARIGRRRWEAAKERMRARLTRSVIKVGTPTGERLGEREVLAALRAPSSPSADAGGTGR